MITYVILLERLIAEVAIGIHAFEKHAPQRVSITIEMEIDRSVLGADDSIADVYDYDVIRKIILDICGSRHFNTQESLCLEILEALVNEASPVKLIVETRKLDVFSDASAVGIRLISSRDVR